MYRVYSRRAVLPAVGCILLGVLLLFGVAGRAMHTSAAKRELPVYSVDTEEKVAALGINCAWDDSDIDKLIGLLDERKIKATFFLVGDWCKKYPEAAKKLSAAGHELGSHSNTHPDMTKLGREEIVKELDDSKRIIEETTGQKLHLFRAPSGAYNDMVISTAHALGWEAIQWSNDSVDWKTPPVEEMVEKVCGRAAPGDIMLWHAGKANTPAALAQTLDQLTTRGYHFVTVGELIYPAPYTIDHTGRQSPKM